MSWSYNRSKLLDGLYSKEGTKKSKELVEEITEAWKESTGRRNIPNKRAAYNGLKKLYEMYPDDFMMIVSATMRMREILERELDLAEGGLNGLGSLIKHWNEQQRNGSELDVVVEFISSRHELRQPEYMIGAIVEQIRRIRRGMIPGENNHLEVTDGLLTLAGDLLDKIDDQSGKSNIDDYNVLPNDQLRLFVEFQRILNLAKKPHLVNKMEKRIEKYLKDLEEAEFALRDYYRWWAIRVMLRSKIRCMMTKEARDWEEKRNKLEDSMSKSMKEFVVDLRNKNKGTVMRSLTNAMLPLGDYHRGLAEFLNDPSGIVGGSKKEKRDIQLFAAIVGSSGGMRDNTNLFVNTKTIPVKMKDGTCLIRYLDKSITNAEQASQVVISNNQYLAPVMLVLLGADLVVRFRWFAAPKRLAEYFQVRKNLPASRIGPNDNLDEAERLKRELVGVLGNILRRLRLVLPHQNDPLPIRLMEGWISTLDKLVLKNKNTIPIKGKDCHLSAMGLLSHTCGGFVNWDWSNPWPGGGKGEGRVKPNERLALELFESGGAAKPTVTISNDKANHYPYYPYVIPVTAPTKNPLP